MFDWCKSYTIKPKKFNNKITFSLVNSLFIIEKNECSISLSNFVKLLSFTLVWN